MATFTANTSVDMWNPPSPWIGDVLVASSSQLILTNYTLIGIYNGTGFKYSGYNVVGGTLTGYTELLYNNTPIYSITGLNIKAKTASTYISNGQVSDLFALGLKGNDSIIGSNFNDLLRGFDGNDTITGGGGTDTIFGDKGKDILTGGAGGDAFVFNSKPESKNLDTVTDFVSGLDGLIFDSRVFSLLPVQTNLSSNFVLGNKAIDNNDFLIFNPVNNTLYYDADATGKGKMVEIVKLVGVTEMDASLDLLAL